MCKKILSLLAFFHICMMMIFSCCEPQTEDAPKETPPATSVNPQKPTITVVSDKTLEYKVNDTAKALAIEAKITDKGKLSYAWYKSDSESGSFDLIENATDSKYVPATSEIRTLYYKCTVTNTLDGKTSSADSPVFTVTVTAKEGEANPPKVSAEKTEYETEVNKNITLKVTAESIDDGELSYKWIKSSDNVNFTELQNETSASLTFTAQTVGTFYYKCEVTNSVEISGTTKTAASDIIFTVTVISASGSINIDFN